MIVATNLSTCPLQSRLIVEFLSRATRRVPQIEQELPTTPKNLGFLQVFIGVRVAQSLVFCLVLCGSLCDVKYVLFFNVTSLFIILSDNRIQQSAEQNAFCFFSSNSSKGVRSSDKVYDWCCTHVLAYRDNYKM